MIPGMQIRKKNVLNSGKLLLIITLFLFLISSATKVNAQTPVPLIFNPDWGTQMYVGESWSQTFTASGGIGNYTYAITSGNIPGINLISGSLSASFSGTPTTQGSYSITIRVTDSATPTANTVTVSHTYYVAEPLIFNPTWGSQMYVGDSWTATYAASAGVTPYAYSLTSGSVPGLSFSSNDVNASYSGTPTNIGTYPLSISVTDSAVGGGAQLTANHTYHVMSHTDLEILDIASSHPLGDFRTGYSIWVLVTLNADDNLPASPSQTVEITSNNGGPSCSATLGADGTGECTITFSSTGDYILSANFSGSTYFDASSTTQSIQILANDRVKTLSAGRNHTCMVDETGQVSCWGLEDSYTIKDSSGNILSSVTSGTYSQISAGGYHTCALDNNGTIHCWGDAIEITDPSVIPNSVSGKTVHYINIDAGDDHVCAIDTKFRLHCWGEIIPEILSGIPSTPVKAVSVGTTNDCVIGRSNDRVSCWGLNNNSQLAVPSNFEAKRIDVGNTHTCAIRKSDEHVVCWGTPAMTLPATTTFKEIGSGSNYSCGLNSSNQVLCWGTNSIVQSTPTNTFNNISIGAFHSCAIQPGIGDSFLKCWGGNPYGQSPRIVLSPETLPAYLPLSQSWSQTFTPAGGSSPYNLAASSGLPDVVILSNFQLGGSPMIAGTYNFTLSVNENFPAVDEIHPLKLAPYVTSHTMIVKNPQTTIQITNSDTNVSMGSPVNVTVRITKVGGLTNPEIGGTVTITGRESVSGRTSECSATVSESGGFGVASCAVYFGEAGTAQSITAVYDGDSFYLPGNNTASASTNITPIVIDPKVSAGNLFNCSINGNGYASCWGDNNAGQINPVTYAYKEISSGNSHVCALGVNSQIFCWGWNGYGLVSARPTSYGFVDVTSGETHSCALSSHGSLHCWGNEADGRIYSPPRINFVQVDAGNKHTCALTSGGEPYCWGNNSSGQTTITTSSTLKTISAGGLATCALNVNDEIECWGGSESFRSTIPTGKFLSISVGYAHACALNENREIQCWGLYPQAIEGFFSSISSGTNHNCALTYPDGYLKCWGNNAYGQAPVINIYPSQLTDLQVNQYWSNQVSANGARTTNLSFFKNGTLPDGLTFTSDGQIFGTPTLGNDYTYTIRAIENSLSPALVQDKTYSQRVKGDSIVTINSVYPAERMAGKPVTISVGVSAAANNLFSEPATGNVAIKINGVEVCDISLQAGGAGCTVYFTDSGEKSLIAYYSGDERYLPGDNETDPVNFVVLPYEQELGIVSGESETYIHKSDGRILCLGEHCLTGTFNAIYSAFGVGNNITCGLKMDGNILCVQNNVSSLISGQFVALSVGSNHVCALDIQGNAICWGNNDLEQSSPPPGSFSKIMSGNQGSCGLRNSDQHPVCWGNLAEIAEPEIELETITVGNGHACGIDADGNLICWGENGNGQTDVPVGAIYTQVTSGDNHTCALDNTGKIECWGENIAGQTNLPFGVYSVLDGYGNHTCALRSVDQISCWGGNEHGEAPQIHVNPFSAEETVVRNYWEHYFSPIGGIKPYTAEIISGSLPTGVALEIDTTLSPAGVVAYGIPTNPARYNFVVRWKDASQPHLLLDMPYSLTVTGADLSVEIIPANMAAALNNNSFYFDYKFSNHTPLDIPDVSVEIEIPQLGWENVSLAGMPDCVIDGSFVRCTLSSFPASSVQTLRINGLVTGDTGSELATSAEIIPTLANWPEIHPMDNVEELSVQIANTNLWFTDNFENNLSTVWSGGNLVSAPSGPKYLESDYPFSQTIRLNLDTIPPHKKIKVSFDLYIIGDWQGNGEADLILPSIFSFGESGEPVMVQTTFCNLATCRQSYPGVFLLNAYPPFYGAEEYGGLGYDSTVVKEARYHFDTNFVHTDETLDLTWLAENLPVGARFGLDNVEITLDAGWIWLYLPNIMR